MSIVYMNDVQVDRYTTGRQVDSYDYITADLAAAENGDTIIIPASANAISARLEITAGSGKIQTSLTPVSSIVLLESNAEWDDHPAGVVTSTLVDTCATVSAIRMVNASGTTKLSLRVK